MPLQYSGYYPQTSVTESKYSPLSAWMRDQNGRINSTRARVDHVPSDLVIVLLSVKCLCVLFCYLFNVCVYCFVICKMFVCIVLLSVQCLCVLFCYLLNVCVYCFVICSMFVCIVLLSVQCLCVLFCYLLNVCVYCFVIC